MATPTRKSYTLEFKKQVLTTLTNLDGNVSATARNHNVGRSHVQLWRSQKERILAASPMAPRAGGQKRGRRDKSDEDSEQENQTPTVPEISARKRRRLRYLVFQLLFLI
jgi:transposase-like protein